MIKVKGLKKTFGDNLIFENVSFDVNEGDAIVIIGDSGCGKSTLLRCINKLETPDKGSIKYIDRNQKTTEILDKKIDINKIRSEIGMVYQNFNLFSNLTVLENVILAPMKVNKMKREDAVKEAMQLLKTVGMDNRADFMPSQLSGGQKQRVAIARCLAMKPELILFDEPTSALDPTMVEEVEKVIASLVQGGYTSVIVTHDMRFAKQVANKVIFLANHSIYEEGTAEEIYGNPQRELTRRFLYRSRMFEKELTRKNVDAFSLLSEVKEFSTNYDVSSRNFIAIDHIIDEFVLPILYNSKTPKKINFRFVADDAGDKHQLLLEIIGTEEDPLKDGIIDELALNLVKGFVKSVKSNINGDDNWEINIGL